MNKKIFLLTISFTLLFLSCKKPPSACIELSTSTVTNGDPVEFTSCSKGALSYEWFIKGPDTAPENNMGWSDEAFSHAFTVPGTYTVTLTAYEDFSFEGEKSTATESLLIN